MKVYFKTVGCRVNQVESQSLAEKFLSLGYEPAAAPEDADVVVLNSCSVTEYADRDTFNFIKRTVAANPKARLVVTGCAATLEPEKILKLAPGAEIFPNKDKEKIPFKLADAPVKEDFFSVGKFAGRTRAFIKIQDGCDLGCAYCLVPAARSEIKSKNSAVALEEIRNLAASGFREIVLCGTRLGMYKCPETGKDLTGLMKDVFALPGDFRTRFSSLEPVEVSEELAVVLRGGGNRFCDYFHLPLQAGSDAVLKAMGRPYNTAGYMGKLEILRKNFKEPGLFADVIAGFPTETEEQFSETLAFVEECCFAGLHVFRFSRRPGTRAHDLKPLPSRLVSERAGRLRALDARLRASYAASMCGRSLTVLVLKNKNGSALGLASNFLNVSLKGEFRSGSFVRARITGSAGGVCSGEEVSY
ncbi:MAG: hypothetical protein A2X28_08095 [Elusimicrobia bacterium GWA2_56_46]|nr:MAG: hypothetical protein A2X28_08095 [Elusimicrobia bacterium GWA2_56_46]OGR54284.1 MAG: hypothetical protein A2X39_03615 [Elusimicrobia bacterium GWC2_56_31]HBB66983.1 hypothetical protein [Elusimicrobiota bacterium]HBW22431.1 hypothetical protein [Elusimicrobiota bacterium]